AYQHDGAGRRVAASGLGGTRGFLTAPQRGDGYDSPHLVTDGAGGLAAAWVWLGAEPLMRFGATGPIYYLSDAMGSVIGLADAVGGNAATFHYDGFGNLRQSSGPSADAPAALGGDVRFHGLWQESATGLYHVRAREYDPRTGRFASRDPIEPDLQRPETLHPYSFAASNPHLYADPTGLFTLVEINISINIRGSMGAFQTGLINFLRHEGYEIAGEIATRMLERFINNMIPWHGAIGRVDKRFHKSTSTGEHGDFFEALSGGVMCGVLEASGVGDWIRLEVEIAGDGEPQNDGLGCGYDRDGISFPSGGPPRPDFVISSKSMEDVRKRRGKAFLVGDFKIAGKNIKQNSPQFGSILSFASRYEYVPIALFVTWRDTSVLRRENLRRKALEKHVILWLLSIKGSLH
ncbi:MAG: RHS repeat-associated core domain-containing protein, partial [Acidobacteriota bacterium]